MANIINGLIIVRRTVISILELLGEKCPGADPALHQDRLLVDGLGFLVVVLQLFV